VHQAIGDLPVIRSGGGKQSGKKIKKPAKNTFQRNVRKAQKNCTIMFVTP